MICIGNELLMMMRSDKKASKDVYLYDSIGSDKEGNEISLIDIIEYEDEDVAERVTMQENISKLGKIINNTLNSREKDIIIMRYGLDGREEKTQREIAAKYGISRSYVSRISLKSLMKILYLPSPNKFIIAQNK